jgi:hypothetical protein
MGDAHDRRVHRLRSYVSPAPGDVRDRTQPA